MKCDWIGLVERSGYEAGAAPRRERNVSPAGEFSAPHNVASATQLARASYGQPTALR